MAPRENEFDTPFLVPSPQANHLCIRHRQEDILSDLTVWKESDEKIAPNLEQTSGV